MESNTFSYKLYVETKCLIAFKSNCNGRMYVQIRQKYNILIKIIFKLLKYKKSPFVNSCVGVFPFYIYTSA